MAISLQVIYPASEGTKFDFDYYMKTHVPMVKTLMGDNLKTITVTKGLAGGPETSPGYVAIASLIFADQERCDAAMAASGPAIEDIKNFTNIDPDLLIGEVMAQ